MYPYKFIRIILKLKLTNVDKFRTEWNIIHLGQLGKRQRLMT